MNAVHAVRCSPNLEEILVAAKSSAARRGDGRVGEADLFRAFVESGGGRVGQWLRDQGVVFEALVSELFLDDGDLDLVRFDEAARGVLRRAIECARSKTSPVFGRRHLIHAMLLSHAGPLARRLREQGLDPERLGDLLFVSMATGAAGPRVVDGRAGEMTLELLRTLCAAEGLAREAPDRLVDENHLLRACFRDGAGETGRFLVEHGVRLSRLLQGD